jgi:parallel beta-helix repeat protein
MGIYCSATKNSRFFYNIVENSTTNILAGSGCIKLTNYEQTPPRNTGFYNNTIICHLSGQTAFNIGDNGYASGIDSIYIKNNIVYLDNPGGYGMYFYDAVGSNNVITNNLYYYPAAGTRLFHIGPDTSLYDYPNISAWKTASYNFTTPAGGYEINTVTDPDNSTFINTDLTNLQLKNSSNAILAGVEIGFTQDFVGKNVSNPPDIGAYQNSSYISGFLSSTTLSGNVAVTNDVVVPSGNTLTISPGTHIKIKNYSSITVYGTLDCNYNSQQGDITFDLYPNFESFEEDTVWFMIFSGSSSSGSILQHATINHNYKTLCLVGADVSITNCNFLYSTEGIYFYDSAPSIMNNTIHNPQSYGLWGEASGLSPWIQGNTIEKTTNLHNYAGIFLSNSTVPTIYNNYISGFYWGLILPVDVLQIAGSHGI